MASSKRPRASDTWLTTRPFSRLAARVVRYLSTFVATGDWMRLVSALPDADRRQLLRFVHEQYYDQAAAGLFRAATTFQKMVTATLSQITKLTLHNVGVLPDPTTWQDWMQNAPLLVELDWEESNVDHGHAVERHLRALALGVRRWKSLAIRLKETTVPLDDALMSGLVVERDLGARPLTFLRFFAGTPLQPSTAQKILRAFSSLNDARLSVDWNDALLQATPPNVTTLALLAREPRDWPDVKVVQSFFEQRKDTWQRLSLWQGHLILEIERAGSDQLPMFDLTTTDEHDFDKEEDSPATMFSPDLLLLYWTMLFPRWHHIDVHVPVRAGLLVASLAKWLWFGDNHSVGKLMLRRDELLAPEDDHAWDDAKEPWFDEDDIKLVVRALKTGHMSSLEVISDHVDARRPVRQLVVRGGSYDFINLHAQTVVTWLLHLPPMSSIWVSPPPPVGWSADDIQRFLAVMQKRKDPLLHFMVNKGPSIAKILKPGQAQWPVRQLHNVLLLPSTFLQTLNLEHYPLDDPGALCRNTTSKMPNLRKISLYSRRPIGRDEWLLFPPELEELSWLVRTEDESKEPMDEQLLMDVARRYPLLKRLEVDVRPARLRAQPPTSTFWREWIALLPQLKQLKLTLDSPGFTWNERHMLGSVEFVVVRLSPGAPFAPYHRFASPLDVGDTGGLMWTTSDTSKTIPMLDPLRRWPQRLVYALPDEEAKWTWPEMHIADGDKRRSGNGIVEYWAMLSNHFNFSFGGWPTEKRWHAGYPFLFDRQRRTVEYYDHSKAGWSHLSMKAVAAHNKEGEWKPQASWPNTWYAKASDEGQGSYLLGDEVHITPPVLNALYVTMRLLNPDVPPERIGQALFLPDGRTAIYDQFEAFYYATDRKLLNVQGGGSAPHSTPAALEGKGGGAAPPLMPAALESKAMTDDRLTVSDATQNPLVVIRQDSLPAALRVDSSEPLSPPMQLLARDAARLVLGCDQVHFGQLGECALRVL